MKNKTEVFPMETSARTFYNTHTHIQGTQVLAEETAAAAPSKIRSRHPLITVKIDLRKLFGDAMFEFIQAHLALCVCVRVCLCVYAIHQQVCRTAFEGTHHISDESKTRQCTQEKERERRSGKEEFNAQSLTALTHTHKHTNPQAQ